MIAEVEQTIHPLARHSLAELADFANTAENNKESLHRADWTEFEWMCIVDFVLTIREREKLDDIRDAKKYENTSDI